MIKRAPRDPLRLSPCSIRGAGRMLRVGLMALGFVAGATPACADIVAARYDAPTTRYGHAVLGDAIEYGALVITARDGAETRFELPQELVFEDIAPRLANVTGDGKPEVITVEAHQDKGARLVIWGQQGRIFATPFIGTRYRWLAPVGAADFDGDGHIEIAYIDRPHLAKTLRIWRVEGDSFREIATLSGVSNHRIGEDFISGGLRDCGQGIEMVVSDEAWRKVQVIGFSADRVILHDTDAIPDATGFARVMACQDG